MRQFLWRAGMGGLATIAAVAAVQFTTPSATAAPDRAAVRPAVAESTMGGPIARSEVMARARDWYTRSPRLTYDNSRASSTLVPDVDGAHRYGPDCSGMVSMALHLPVGSIGGRNTGTLDDADIAQPIAYQDMDAGDYLDDVTDGHVVLFEAWAADHVHFSYWSFGATPMRHYNGGSGSTEGPLGSIASGVNLASHPSTNYHAYRYRNIVDDPVAGNGVVSGDVTGDGRADMVARKPDGTLSLYVNSGSNTAPYSTGTLIGSSWQSFRWFLAGDVTGDGRADIVAAGQDGTLTLYTNGGSNTAPYASGIVIGSGWQNFRNVTLADVTGDGRADLVAAGQDGTLTLYANGGSNTAPYASGIVIGSSWQQFSRIMAGDVTGDGRADIVATKPDGTLSLYVNGGSNTAPYSSGITIGSGWQNFRNVALADVTGDGRADLVTVGQDGTLSLYTNSGNNTAPYSSAIVIGSSWQTFA